MKRAPSPCRWPAYARLPDFLPVPTRARADGWTSQRQADFIGHLAETGSVAEAARRVGCSRESAYRLRRRAGAESFAAAWDAAVAAERLSVQVSRKFTEFDLHARAIEGAFHVRMRRGRFVRAERKPCTTSLIRLVSHFKRSTREIDW
jgi:transposase-like protein